MRNKRNLSDLDRPALAALNIQCALPAAGPRLLTLRLVCHSYSAGLPTQCLIKLQLRDRLCMRTHISHQPIVSSFRFEVCSCSNSSSGIASTASGAISCCAFTSTGGERAGAIAGAVVGSPTCARICRTVAGSVIKPIRRTRPLHPLHLSANTPEMRASSSCAHKYRAGCPLRGAALSASTAFGRGGLRPAASFRPACAVTSSRHGEFGASTPK